MSRRSIPLVAVLIFAAVGCNKPKDTCEGTMDSYIGCINSQDWDCMVELMHPAERKKFTDKRLAQMLPARYGAIDAVYAAAASACRDRSGRLRCGPQSGRD